MKLLFSLLILGFGINLQAHSLSSEVENLCRELVHFPKACRQVSYCEFSQIVGLCTFDGDPDADQFSQEGIGKTVCPIVGADRDQCIEYAQFGCRFVEDEKSCTAK